MLAGGTAATWTLRARNIVGGGRRTRAPGGTTPFRGPVGVPLGNGLPFSGAGEMAIGVVPCGRIGRCALGGGGRGPACGGRGMACGPERQGLFECTGVWAALDVGVALRCAEAWPVFSFSPFSRRRFSSRSRRLRPSSSACTALSSLPSPSKTTRSSSPSPTPGTASESFFPCSFSTHCFASSCDVYRMNTMPRAPPLDLSICGSKEVMVPCTPKCRRIF